MDSYNRIKDLNREILSHYKCKLQKVTLDYQRRDGNWQTQQRVKFSRHNAATILFYNKNSKSVILTSQFRLPTF